MVLEVLALLDERGKLDDCGIAETLGPFTLLKKNHSAMHPGLRHPRHQVSTVPLDEVRHTMRILAQLGLVRVVSTSQRTLSVDHGRKKLLNELAAPK